MMARTRMGRLGTLVAGTALLLCMLLLALYAADPAKAATFTVTKEADTNDGVCDADCSLREAVVASNAVDGEDAISVPAGTYALAIAGAGEDASATGDLDVTDALTVDGEGADVTTVSAGGEAGNTTTPDLGDRIFDVRGDPTVTISGLTVSGGSAVADGGGVRNAGDLTVTGSTVSDNTATTNGGGLFTQDGSLTIIDSTVSVNTANSGGGIRTASDNLTVVGSTVAGNTAGVSGGGISSSTSIPNGITTTIENSTISGNSASLFGGGVQNSFGLTTLENATITGNSAPASSGGGVSSPAQVSDTVTQTQVGSSIIAGNSDSDVDRTGGGSGGPNNFLSQGYNVIGDGNATGQFDQSGDQVNVADPGLEPLGNNGGPTFTHALLSDSPAIDRVSATAAVCPPPATDQRGVSRPKNGDGSGTSACDSGSFERSPGSVRFTSATYTVSESDGAATITLTRDGGTDGQVSVDYETSDGTATSGSDYVTSTGTATFGDGVDSASFTVPITNDATDEANETVNLTLSNPQGGATLGATTSAALTITDNDPAPALSVSNKTIREGDTGTRNATFAVALSSASAKTVTVRYATANGTARQPADYVARSDTLTFAPGQTRKNVVVKVRGDRIDEPNERFSVRLSNATNARLADGLGTGTITDDDRRR